jgi:hypothetical protein
MYLETAYGLESQGRPLALSGMLGPSIILSDFLYIHTSPSWFFPPSAFVRDKTRLIIEIKQYVLAIGDLNVYDFSAVLDVIPIVSDGERPDVSCSIRSIKMYSHAKCTMQE